MHRDVQDGRPLIVAGILYNLEYDGLIDPITGLFRREKCVEQFKSTAGNTAQNAVVLLLGLDYFGRINMQNGHYFGNMVLRTITQEIRGMLPERAMMYHFDGDQFAIVGYQIKTPRMLELYEQIRTYIRQLCEVDKRPCQFTVSAGLIEFSQHGKDWNELEQGLSIALKRAKKNGKDQCVCFTPEMLAEEIREQELGFLLADSVSNGFCGFRIVYQPVCEARSLQVKGAEALLRYDAPNGRTFFPKEFIPLLESSHLIVPVGLWVLEQAILTCLEWIKLLPELTVTVNLSVVQL